MTSFGSPWRDPVVTGPRLLVRISVGYPTDHEFYFTDGAIVDSGFGTGTASVGQATTAFIGKISPGTESEEGFTVVLRNVKPYADNANTDLNYTDLVHLFTAYVFEGATAYLYQYADSAVASDDRTVLANGTVESVTDLTPSTVTLKITEDNPWRSYNVPERAVGDNGWHAENEHTPELSKGLSLPLRLGPRVYVPKGWDYWYNEQAATSLIRSGCQRAALVPCRLGQVAAVGENQREEWDQQEIQSGVVNAYSQATSAASSYVYSPATDTFTEYINAAHATDSQARTAGFHFWYHDRRLPLRGMIIPRYVANSVPFDGSAIDNPEHMFDKRMDTYCTLRGHASSGYLVEMDIPPTGNPGNVNSVANAIQVWIYTLAGQPPGTGYVANGTMRFGMGTPKGLSNWALSGTLGAPDVVACNYTGWRTATTLFGNEYPAYDVWKGTRWQRWDFSSSGTSDGNDLDSKVYQTDPTANRPFRLRIAMTPGTPSAVVHIVGIALVVEYVQGSDDIYRRPLSWNASMPDLSGRKIHERSWTVAPAPENNVDQWNEYVRTGVMPYQPVEANEPVPITPENTFAWHPGLHDGTDAYGTGGDWIESPGPIINYLATQYGNRGIVIGNTTTWGSVKWFDAMMTKWAKLHNISAPKFRLFYWQHDETSVDDAIERITTELPGMARTGLTATGIGSLICTTHSLTDEGPTARHACVTSADKGITLSRDMLMRQDRSLGMEQIRTPNSSIINELEVHYQYDVATGKYGAIARCSASSSDDGFGEEWPIYGDVSAAFICEQSQAHYTKGKPHKKVLYLRYHWYPETAVAVGCWYLWRHWRPYVMVRFDGALSCQDIMPGQLITFNDELRTTGGMGCSIPFLNDNKWYKDLGGGIHNYHNFHVLSNTRMNEPYPGRGVWYEVIAMEHLSIQPAPGALTGGPVIAGEGFDGIL